MSCVMISSSSNGRDLTYRNIHIHPYSQQEVVERLHVEQLVSLVVVHPVRAVLPLGRPLHVQRRLHVLLVVGLFWGGNGLAVVSVSSVLYLVY